jgi:4-diphosphocytidyl-2-C-methyl-D-erythritol kinase
VTRDAVAPNATSSYAVSVPAPAKVNLILRILDRRPDGFHNLWSVMQTIQLEDNVSIRLNQSHADIRLQCDARTLSVDQTNLVHRAAAAVLQACNRKAGLDIVLAKRIPMGAGLGGGSSDAAATIIGLNHLLSLGWSATKMAQVGEALGSDVPFFCFAPSAVVSGRGEQVHPVKLTDSRWIVLVNPGFPIETKWAYQQLSMTRSHVQPLSVAQGRLAAEGKITWEHILRMAENDFEGPVFERYPQLRDIKLQLLNEEAEIALLSGSGATVFGTFINETKARKAVARLSVKSEFKIFVVPAQSSPLLCQETRMLG